MGVQVYISFNGDCRKVVEYYGKVFEAKPEILLFSDIPTDDNFPITDGIKDLVAHATLQIDGSEVMFSDVPPGMEFTQGNNVGVMINTKNKELIKKAFNEFKNEGTVLMELEPTFWSELYGVVKDKYGIEWQFNYNNE